MKFKAFQEKVKELCKKAGMKTLIAVCAVVVLAGIDLSSTDTAESASTLEPNEVADYFAAISLQRKQARDEAKEVLLTVAESATAIDEVKENAITDINKLAAEIEQEANIESLVQSKGFAQCVAVISDEKCSVIVESN